MEEASADQADWAGSMAAVAGPSPLDLRAAAGAESGERLALDFRMDRVAAVMVASVAVEEVRLAFASGRAAEALAAEDLE
jgi:hypothetical protein